MKKEPSINQITEGVIWKQLLLFFFPIVMGTFFQQLYNTADTVIVGRFVGKEALASVGGSTAQIVNLIVGFFVGRAYWRNRNHFSILRSARQAECRPFSSYRFCIFHCWQCIYYLSGYRHCAVASADYEYAGKSYG